MNRRNKQPIKAALFAALLCLSAAAQPQTITGKVVAIADGDTLTVLDASNKQHKIRLEGIDAPESKQDYGSRAKQSLSDLIFGKTVTVTSRKKDKYARTLGTVTLDGKDINQEQLNRGMAWFYRAYQAELPANVAAVYGLAETRARQEKRGLWANAEPTPPWDFRRGKTVKAPGVKPPAATTGLIKGKVIMLDFLAHWCGPCIASIPETNSLKEKYEANGLVIIGLTNYYSFFEEREKLTNAEELTALKEFLSKRNVKFGVIVGPHANEATYGVAGLPAAALIDRKGTVRYVKEGADYKKEIEKIIQTLLAEPAPK